MRYLSITLTALLACGLGTTLGGIIIVIFRNFGRSLLSGIMGIAAGLMLSVVTFDLIPGSMQIGGLELTLIGIFIGVVFITLLDIFMPEEDISKKYGKDFKAALVLVLGLLAHNFPEGLAIGSGFIGSLSLGLKLTLVIAAHDIPEGAAVAAFFLSSKLKSWKIVLLTFATALPTALGAYIGARVSDISGVFVALCLGFAGGTMLYIVCGEMIPKSKNLSEGIFSTLSVIIGVIAGLILIAVL